MFAFIIRTSPPPARLLFQGPSNPTPTSPIDSYFPALLLPRGTVNPVPLHTGLSRISTAFTNSSAHSPHPSSRSSPPDRVFLASPACDCCPPTPTQASPSWANALRWIARTPGTLPCVHTSWIRSSTPGVDLPQEVIPDARERHNVSRLDAHRARRGGSRSARPECDQVCAT